MFSQPGVRFMHKLKAANPDAVLSVEGLPAGLTYNAGRQLVEGIVEAEGEYTYTVKIHAEGEEDVEEPVSLTVSSTLQQPVPFMGWLSWNVFERAVSENDLTGIGAPAAGNNPEVSVKAVAGQVQVTVPGTTGEAKRILVSDLSGRVIASATSKDETVTLPVRGAKGVFVVDCTVNGIATATKVKF